MVPRELLVNAYAGAYGGSILRMVFSPYGDVHGSIVPVPRETDPNSAGGGAVPDGGITGCPIGILPAAKLILHRSPPRDSVSASG
jgi:hypothetical protein